MNKRLVGSLQVALAAISWSFAGVFCKWLPWNSFTVNGFRAIFATLFLLLLRRKFEIKFTFGTVLGAIGVGGTSVLFMLSTKLTSAANAIVLQYAMPIFIIAFVWIFFKQKPATRDLVAAVVILIGVVLCSWSGLGDGGNLPNSMLGNILALLSAVTFSLVFFCSKMEGANSEHYTLLGVMAGIPTVVGAFTDPNFSFVPMHFLGIAAMGLCLALGYFFIAKGIENTSPLSAALLSNLEPILNPLWVFVFLGEQPDVFTLVGASIVLVAATVYTVLQSR